MWWHAKTREKSELEATQEQILIYQMADRRCLSQMRPRQKFIECDKQTCNSQTHTDMLKKNYTSPYMTTNGSDSSFSKSTQFRQSILDGKWLWVTLCVRNAYFCFKVSNDNVILSQTQGPYHKGNGITQEHEMDHSGLQSWCQLIIVV